MRRHVENTARLDAVEKEQRETNSSLRVIVDAVAVIKPIVDGYQVTRMKFAGGLAVVLFIAGALGWLVVALISKAIELVAKKIGL